MTKRKWQTGTAVQAAPILLLVLSSLTIRPCEAQVSASIQRTADQTTVFWGDPATGSARQINVGQKLQAIQALREQLIGNLSTQLEAITNGKKLSGQEVSDLRAAADKLTKVALYCRDLADRVQQQHPESLALTDWLRANELLLKTVDAMDFSSTPINQTRLITDLDDIVRRGNIGSDPMLQEWIQTVRGPASGNPDTYICGARYLRALVGYTPAGVGVDVFQISASPGSVPQGDPVHIGISLTMLGEGDCHGQNLAFELQPAPGQPVQRRSIAYLPGDQSYNQSGFTIDTKALRPGTYTAVATVRYMTEDPGGANPRAATKTSRTGFEVTAQGAGAGPSGPSPGSSSGKQPAYMGTLTVSGHTCILALELDFSSGSGKIASGYFVCTLPGGAMIADPTGLGPFQTAALDFELAPQPSGPPDFLIRQKDNKSGLSLSGSGRFESGAPAPGTKNVRVALSLAGGNPWTGIVTLALQP